MKRVRWYVWLAVAAFAMLTIDVMAFGGATLIPDVGKPAAKQARNEQPLTHTYMAIGRGLVEAAPALRGPALGLAEAVWKDAIPVMREQPRTAAARMFDSGRGVLYDLVRLSFWGGPLGLLVALVGWVRRPRQVSLMGSPGQR